MLILYSCSEDEVSYREYVSSLLTSLSNISISVSFENNYITTQNISPSHKDLRSFFFETLL